MAWLYKWLPRICGCHCRPDRSFYWHGRQFPVCARCTGELLGLVLGIIGGIVFGLHPILALLMLVPMVLDGFIQLLTRYESKNVRRLWTGLLFGYGLWTIEAWLLCWFYQIGYNWTSNR